LYPIPFEACVRFPKKKYLSGSQRQSLNRRKSPEPAHLNLNIIERNKMMAKNNGITLAYHDRPCVAKQKRT